MAVWRGIRACRRWSRGTYVRLAPRPPRVCVSQADRWGEPAATSAADRRSTNNSQSQTRKPAEPQNEFVLLAASATVTGAWSRAAPSCRILSRQTNSWRCTLVTPHTLRPSPRGIRARHLHHDSDAPRLPAPCPRTTRARRVWRLCRR